jgi:hypothetical protein
MDLFKRKRLRRSTLKESTNWEDVGRMQFEFLLREGLQPHHHLLDIGCGSFRGGRFVIDYLQEGHYFGIDCYYFGPAGGAPTKITAGTPSGLMLAWSRTSGVSPGFAHWWTMP